jgi:DNA-binding CsgD family transcriptional regulator
MTWKMMEILSQPMASSDSDILIPYPQFESIVQLLGDLVGFEGDLPSRKRILMDGLAHLLDADGWLWSATQVIKEQDRPVSVGILYAGLTEQQFNGWLEASQVARNQPPEDKPLTVLLNQRKHFTRARHQVVPDHVWYNHPTVKRYRLALGIDHFLYSIYPLCKDHCSVVGLFRQVGREPFSDLQRCLCHVVVANIKWLHQASFPDHEGIECLKLSPRQRTVLIHLLNGKSRDEIAQLLHVSSDTVKSHIRSVYRHFNVDSQVQLMRWFHTGGLTENNPAHDEKD